MLPMIAVPEPTFLMLLTIALKLLITGSLVATLIVTWVMTKLMMEVKLLYGILYGEKIYLTSGVLSILMSQYISIKSANKQAELIMYLYLPIS